MKSEYKEPVANAPRRSEGARQEEDRVGFTERVVSGPAVAKDPGLPCRDELDRETMKTLREVAQTRKEIAKTQAQQRATGCV